MSTYFEINYFKRVAKINYVLLTIFLAVSACSHAMASRLVLIAGYPLISATLIYMIVFVLTDVFASYNPRRLVVIIICLEALFNLLFVGYANGVASMPYPSYFHYAQAYKQVFSPVVVLYFANLLGISISSLVDLFIFYYLYRRRRWIFFIASFCSSIVTVSLYTYVTDYFAFRDVYPLHLFELIRTNIVSNSVTLLIYSILGQFLVMFIHKRLNPSGGRLAASVEQG